MPDEGLAERLRAVRLREASETDEAAVKRAMEGKASLADHLDEVGLDTGLAARLRGAEGRPPRVETPAVSVGETKPAATGTRRDGSAGATKPETGPAEAKPAGKTAPGKAPGPKKPRPMSATDAARAAQTEVTAAPLDAKAHPDAPDPTGRDKADMGGTAKDKNAAKAKAKAKAQANANAKAKAGKRGTAAKGSGAGKESEVKAAGFEDSRSALDWFLGRRRQEAGDGPITEIPPLLPGWEEVEMNDIEAPFSFVRIERNIETREILYRAIEPRLDRTEREILEFVTDALVRGLNVDPTTLKVEEREEFLQNAMRQIIHDYRIHLSKRSQARVEYFLRRDFLGLGAIHVVMVDPDIEDVSCDGPGVPLFIFHRRHESIPSTIIFPTDAVLDGFVIRLAQRSGRAISVSDPILDAALPDGSRLQATLGQEVTQNGSTFTIRRFKPDPFTPIDLVRFGTMNARMLAWFWLNVQHGHSLIFSGGTASGKTTGLNAISQFIPHQAKIVSIEDTREVNLPHENWIKAVTRSGSTSEGTGEIGMFELLKASLRQRPEYILVGEVRGIEATVAFQAMATGHTVYSTMHADSARSVVYRLENDPINVPRLVLQALDIIAIQSQARYQGKRVRRIKEIVELVGMDPATRELLTNTVFKWDPSNDTFRYQGRSYLVEQIAQARNMTKDDMHLEFERRVRIIEHLVGRNEDEPISVEELGDIVRTYYRDPDSALAMVGLE